MDYKRQMYEQLAADFNVTPDDLLAGKNLFVPKRYIEGRRIYRGDTCILQVLATNGMTVMTSTDERLLSWCADRFQNTNGAWICEIPNLRAIDEKLHELGHQIADAHHYYIPGQGNIIFQRTTQVRWYDAAELQKFRGDERFCNAIGGDQARPDMLAVAAILDGRIAGMAGASADSPASWQIGIDVLPESRNQGIGSQLTALLKSEIQRRGILPFYGTGESHIQSQSVAVNAGFVPGWWELYTKQI